MSKIHSFFNQKRHSIYAQLSFTALAFILMVLLSYLYVSDMVHKYLVNRAENMIDFERMKIEANLMEPSTALGIFSEAVREMIINGDDDSRLIRFFEKQYSYLKNGSVFGFSGYKGFYGYFNTLRDIPVYISGAGLTNTDDQIIMEHPWYIAAIAAHGEIGETLPHINSKTGEILFSYSRCIYDDDGMMLGIVCLDVCVNEIGQYISDTALTQGGYGILISQDLTVMAHPNKPFIGLATGDPSITFSIFEDELRCGMDISERKFISFYRDDSIAFFKKLSNGWFLGLITPKGPFYQDVTRMAVGIGLLGAIFATALILILIRIDAARRKSDTESQHKSIFLANMSHEIRTPMNAIIGMSMMGKATDDIRHKDYCLSKIDNASKHLLGVINDILDMSKIESNNFELSLAEFNFEKMLQRIIGIINFRMDEKHHRFIVNIDKNIPKNLIGDDQRLAQVITNLLGNASKFTGEGGLIQLDICLLHEENNVCTIQVTVKDTGIGISGEQQQKLFKSFQQADANTTRKYGGTGLGLAICKNIIEMMGGSIWLKSELGEGSTFGFTIDLKRCENNNENNPEEKNLKAPYCNFAGRCVLLTEDIEINREIVSSLLEPTQIKIDCAVNGADAVRLFTERYNKYDLVLMDLQMPEMDGYEATRHIRSLEEEFRTEGENFLLPARKIPIIAMTANVFREDIEKCLEAGMNDHIGKPLDVDELMGKLRFYLNKV